MFCLDVEWWRLFQPFPPLWRSSFFTKIFLVLANCYYIRVPTTGLSSRRRRMCIYHCDFFYSLDKRHFPELSQLQMEKSAGISKLGFCWPTCTVLQGKRANKKLTFLIWAKGEGGSNWAKTSEGGSNTGIYQGLFLAETKANIHLRRAILRNWLESSRDG